MKIRNLLHDEDFRPNAEPILYDRFSVCSHGRKTPKIPIIGKESRRLPIDLSINPPK